MMAELHCDPGFRQLLVQHFAINLLEQHPGTIYGIWPDLSLAYMNPAWFRFARHNQGDPAIPVCWTRGRMITDALPEVLHPYYVELYLRALENNRDQPLLHEYECSSPEQFRRFSMSLHNLGFGAGLLVINREVQAEPHWRQPNQGVVEFYQDDKGRYQQCSHCRCFRNLQHPVENRWDWIPDWLDPVPGPINHSLCPACFKYYYSCAA